MKNYTTFSVDGITIWKAQNVKPAQDNIPIAIGIKKMWIIYELTISGVKQVVNAI